MEEENGLWERKESAFAFLHILYALHLALELRVFGLIRTLAKMSDSRFHRWVAWRGLHRVLKTYNCFVECV